MYFVMALKSALASKITQILEPQWSVIRKRKYYRCIKIDEITIVRSVSLAEADTMRVMTCRTWGVAIDMLLMLTEALVI